MKRTESVNARSRSNSSHTKATARRAYVMCIDNDGYPVSLDIGKVYRVLAPHPRMPPGWLRVVDESGEDYLFPAKRFVPVELPPKGKRALAAAK